MLFLRRVRRLELWDEVAAPAAAGGGGGGGGCTAAAVVHTLTRRDSEDGALVQVTAWVGGPCGGAPWGGAPLGVVVVVFLGGSAGCNGLLTHRIARVRMP